MDHLTTAKFAADQIASDVVVHPAEVAQVGSLHALLAIAEELKRHNDRAEAKPEVSNNITVNPGATIGSFGEGSASRAPWSLF